MRVTCAPPVKRRGAFGWWAAGLAIWGTWTAQAAHSQEAREDDARTMMELTGMGKRGQEIFAARRAALNILSSENECSVWFREASRDPAAVFRTLHFQLEEQSKVFTDSAVTEDGHRLYRDPWGAMTHEGAGANSLVILNVHGPFFRRATQVLYVDMAGNFVGPGDQRALVLGRYPGGSREAQVVTLLHELGHIIALLPEDDDSWNGRSSQNTEQVVRHCGAEIQKAVKKATWSRAEVARNR